MNPLRFLVALCFCFSCGNASKTQKALSTHKSEATQIRHTSLLILGNVQDAGSPHIACKKECCKELFENAAAEDFSKVQGVWKPQTQKM